MRPGTLPKGYVIYFDCLDLRVRLVLAQPQLPFPKQMPIHEPPDTEI